MGVMHLDVLLMDNLSLHVLDYTRLSSVTGRVSAGISDSSNYTAGLRDEAVLAPPDFTFVPARDTYHFDSRVIEVTTTTGNIDGNWPLYDMLGLHSTSGEVRVSVTPQDELKSNPKPAILSLSTVSGDIGVVEPIFKQEKIPLRDYLVDIKSTSGGIHGTLAFGEGIGLKSTASDIALDLLPVMNMTKISTSRPAQMETVTTSGTTAIRILEPLWFSENQSSDAVALGPGPLNCLEAVHKSVSGSVGLHYPQSWEGELNAETTSGSLHVKGKDVKIVKYPSWPGNKLVAQKGDNISLASSIKVHAVMGTLDALIGDDN